MIVQTPSQTGVQQSSYTPVTGWQASVFTPTPNAPVTYVMPAGTYFITSGLLNCALLSFDVNSVFD